MRNLISLAIAYAVVLTENDVLELGYNVTEEEFKQYFEIPEEAVSGEFKKNEEFTPSSIVQFMNTEESAEFVEGAEKPAKEEKPAKGKGKAAKKPTTEESATEESATEESATEKPTEEKNPAEPKKPGVIASILEVIQNSKTPVSETQILAELVKRFPDKESASMHKTIKAQLGGKEQPLRMESEKNVKFALSFTEAKEGEKAQRLYAIAK